MRIEILDLAKADLLEGFHFYEVKEQGLGDYFLTNIFSDIERLKISGEFTDNHTVVFTVPCPKDFLLPSITLLSMTLYGFDQLLIAGDTRNGFGHI